MKKIPVVFILLLTILCSCGKDNFYDKFVPEVLFYKNADVENADFKEITLAPAITAYTVKARVSAPMKLKEIKVYRMETGKTEVLVQTYNDFQLTPKVYKVRQDISTITAETTIKISAVDVENKTTVRSFVIRPTP